MRANSQPTQLAKTAALLSCQVYSDRPRLTGRFVIEHPPGKIAALVMPDNERATDAVDCHESVECPKCPECIECPDCPECAECSSARRAPPALRRRHVVVAFSGCRSIDELLRCANVGFAEPASGVPGIPGIPGIPASVGVNAAVWRRYADVRAELAELLLSLRATDVTFTGHSLGGAVAQLAALMCTHASGCSISFGAPRVGDTGYAAAVRAQGREHTRYVLERDVVPKLRLHAKLVHAGDEVLLVAGAPSSAPFPLDLVDNHSSKRYLNLLSSGARAGRARP